jgi:hypothetical protein
MYNLKYSIKNFIPFLILPLNYKIYSLYKSKSKDKLFCNNNGGDFLDSLDTIDKK